MKSITQALFLAAALTVAVVAVPASAQPFDDDDIQQTVARISYISGSVSFNRGDNPDDWHLAARNYPLTLGDRIYAGRDGRAELLSLRPPEGFEADLSKMLDDLRAEISIVLDEEYSKSHGSAARLPREVAPLEP